MGVPVEVIGSKVSPELPNSREYYLTVFRDNNGNWRNMWLQDHEHSAQSDALTIVNCIDKRIVRIVLPV